MLLHFYPVAVIFIFLDYSIKSPTGKEKIQLFSRNHRANYGRTNEKEGIPMKIWPLALGAGMVGGAVAVMMLPRNCTVRQMATQAAEKVEDAVYNVVDKMTAEM